jgi:hypothetical protein
MFIALTLATNALEYLLGTAFTAVTGLAALLSVLHI